MKKNDQLELYNQFIRINNKFAIIKKKHHEVSNNANLYPAEMQMLCLLNADSELTVTDLAANLYITKSAASQLVKKLSMKGMLQKYRSKENERVVVLKITDKGKETVDNFFSSESNEFGELVKEFSSMPNQDLEIIRIFLKKLEDMFDKKLQ
jgi:DNA-binding MarR family transcriptional regulator